MENIVLSAAQATPVFLDRAATINKACDLMATAAGKGAKLIVFPEAFVPCYPDWVWVIPPNQNKLLADLYGRLVDQSMTIRDPTRRNSVAQPAWPTSMLS